MAEATDLFDSRNSVKFRRMYALEALALFARARKIDTILPSCLLFAWCNSQPTGDSNESSFWKMS